MIIQRKTYTYLKKKKGGEKLFKQITVIAQNKLITTYAHTCVWKKRGGGGAATRQYLSGDNSVLSVTIILCARVWMWRGGGGGYVSVGVVTYSIE